MIRNGKYYDANGNELHDGDMVRWSSGRVEMLYAWSDEDGYGLGVDATNPKWIESGRAYPCEFGIYPLTDGDTEEIVKA